MKEKYFEFCAGTFYNGGFYFSNMDYNALYFWGDDTKKPMYLGSFPDEPAPIFFLHKACLRKGDRLIFIPEAGSHFHIYDVKTQEFISLKFERRNYDFSPVAESVWVEDKLYVFPSAFDSPVYVIDPEKGMFEEDWTVSEWCKKHIVSEGTLKLARIAENNGKIYAAIYNSDTLLVIDTKDFGCSTQKINGTKLFAAFDGGDRILIATNNSDEIYELKSDGSIDRLKESSGESDRRAYNHIIPVDDDHYIFVFAYKADLVVWNRKNRTEKLLCNDAEIIDEIRPCYFGYSKVDKGIILHPFNTTGLLKVDMKSMTTEQLAMDKDIYDYSIAPYNHLVGRNEIHNESDWFGLEDFIQYI